MPSNSADGAIARQWEILKLMPASRSRGMIPADMLNELSERGFSVHLRTVQRDLKALADVFDLECVERDGRQYWRWQAGARLDIQSMELTDALTLRLIETSLRALLPAGVLRAMEPRLLNAAQMLNGVSPRNRLGGWPNKVASVLPTVPFIPPKIDSKVLEVVQKALLEDSAIDCLYRSVGASSHQKLALHPLGLVLRGPTTYLVATAFDYAEPRAFALHRMTRAEDRYEKAKRPMGFSLREFIDRGGIGFGQGEQITLVARVSPMLAREVEETRLSEDQRIKADGDWFWIEATVRETWQLRWWLMSKMDDLVVIEPEALRETITASLKSALSRYGTR